jgi:glycosyltransferase involved in cell wall biosynthesis
VSECNAGLDVIVLTSNNEGTPVSLIEAQAAGKFIVSTKVGGIEDIVEDGRNAFLVEKGNDKMFAQALLKVLHDDNLRQNVSTTGRAHTLERFGYERLCSDMSKLYTQLLNVKKP